MACGLQALYDLGIFPQLIVTVAEVRAFTGADLENLRDDFGATDAMIAEMLALARRADVCAMGLDFEQGTVTVR